jgi:dihydropteroate synthase
MEWRCRDRTLICGGPRTLVMGVLNVTPDSFSDGGRFAGVSAAAEAGMALVSDGADLLDIGGESSRPGAVPVSAEEEIRRVIPVLLALRAAGCPVPVSVDTCKSVVARAALEAGADIVNDITALRDPEMISVVRDHGAGAILMHMRGGPRTMQAAPIYRNVAEEVDAFLRGRLEAVVAAGIGAERIALDPGIGFGKTAEHNLRLLADLPRPDSPARPWVLGISRKSLVGAVTGRPAGERGAGSLAFAVYGALRGASILRAHDVKETCDAVRVADTMRAGEAVHGRA